MKYILLFSLNIAAFLSCNKAENLPLLQLEETNHGSAIKHDPISSSASILDINVTNEDGILVFPSVQDYNLALVGISNATEEQYLNWITSLSFDSQYSIFNEIRANITWNEQLTPVEPQMSTV